MKMERGVTIKSVDDQAGLSRTRHTRDADQHPKGKIDVELLEVVVKSPAYREHPTRPVASFGGDLDAARP